MSESKAKQYFLRIPDGHKNPLPRPKDLSRAREVLLKRIRMRDAFRKRIDIEVFTDHTRKAE